MADAANTDLTKDDFFSTWRSATFHPSALHARLAAEPARRRPLAFALTVGAIAAPAGAFIETAVQGSPWGGFGAALGALIVSPLRVIFVVYLCSALTHFWLLVVRGNKGTFRDTVATVCYSTAPQLFGVVPAAGLVVGLVWQVVTLCIGLRHAQRTTAGRAIFAGIMGTLSPVLLALSLRGGVVEAFKIPSGAMIPSILIGDHIFVEKLSYGPLIPWTDARLYSGLPPRRGDVIVFKFPENKEQDFIKRTIAIPGDTLEAINGRPILNGWLVPHCYVGSYRYEGRQAELFVEYLGDKSYFTLYDANPDEQSCVATDDCGPGLTCRLGLCGLLQGPFHVGQDEVWVMGDNRNNSHDSRSWRGGRGAGVPFENIKGRATFVWISFGPGGNIAQDRIFLSVNGSPVLPASNAGLEGALAKCLRDRPSATQATPSGRTQN